MDTVCEICEEQIATKKTAVPTSWGHAVILECTECAHALMTDPEMVRWHGGKATVRDITA